nr:TetR family transcriptional regulator [Kribbella italica]
MAARQRLLQAALDLFQEHGFDRTTTAQIARRAGVTERTFFHHFPDKREVLFGGQEHLRDLLRSAVRDAPGELSPLDVLLKAFQSLHEVMEDSRSYLQQRQQLIAATPALREREVAKLAYLADELTEALQEHAIPHQPAALAGHTAAAAFNIAASAWLADPTEPLNARLASAFEDLRFICTEQRSKDSERPANR